MLKIAMYSAATKVKGQGVGSAYIELIQMLKKHFPEEMEITINKLTKAQVSHYHTVNFPYYLSTFLPGRGCKVGYVHFLPETLKGSLKLPFFASKIFDKYLISFYKRMDQLVVVNPSFIPKLEAYGIKKEKITYIPNFVSQATFYHQDNSKVSAFKRNLGVPPEKFVVVGVGQIQERKGVFDFIELARRLPQIQFIWVGGFSFGKITDGYEQLKHVVDNPPANLLFPGIVDRNEMAAYYNVADLFLLPSYNELFPMSILEAFSCQTPVMVRELTLYHSVIAGYYEPAQDVEEMEAKILQYSTEPQYLKELKEKAKRAAHFYSEDRLAKIWYRYYNDVAKR